VLERQRFTGGKGRDTERCVDDADCRGVSSSVVPRIEAVANRSSSTFPDIFGSGKNTRESGRRPWNSGGLRFKEHSLVSPFRLYAFITHLSPFSLSADSFGKSNVAYITWIVGGILVAEGVTGGMSDMLWSAANRGRLYESVDWTKFIVEDDDDDDDDDDEEDGDDDDEE